MASINDAVAALKSQETPNIAATARDFNVNRSTLSRHFNLKTSTRAGRRDKFSLLTRPQEKELINHIHRLSKRGLPPPPSLVANFVTEISGRRPGNNWVARFIKRHSQTLDSKYLNTLESARSKADSVKSYNEYFDSLELKIAKYNVQPHNIYNMDEKGFLIGHLTKSKRVFTKSLQESGRLVGAAQDGSREWITIIATICADGSTLSPGLIYKGSSGNLRDTWLEGYEPSEHSAFFAASPNGWTSDELGFEYLTKIFDRETKNKAERDWRLLILDGHGSHVNLKFLDWCQNNRILVDVFPPHATHRLQPLDVSLFAPLSIYYSQQLDQHMRKNEGFTAVTKRDFFELFWPAYQKAFSDHNVASGWKQTGLVPFDPQQVLRVFQDASQENEGPESPDSHSDSSQLSRSEWRAIRTVIDTSIQREVDRRQQKQLKRFSNTFLGMSATISLQDQQIEQLQSALCNEKKRRKRGKQLMEEFRDREGTSAIFFSPSKIASAKQLQLNRELEKQQQQQAKQLRAEEREAAKRRKLETLEQNRQIRLKARETRAALAAARVATRKAARINKQVNRQTQQDHQAGVKRPRGRPKKQQPVPEKARISKEPEGEEYAVVRSQRSGRIVKPSAKCRR